MDSSKGYLVLKRKDIITQSHNELCVYERGGRLHTLACRYTSCVCIQLSTFLLFLISLQLTYGLTEKEIARKGGVANLVYSDSVKSKVKDYIRQYMKKFGPVYIRT